MSISADLTAAIGGTPLTRLRHASESTGCTIPGKAKFMILDAEARGYRTVFTMSDTQSAEKQDALRLLGAEMHEGSAVPFKDSGYYVHAAAG